MHTIRVAVLIFQPEAQHNIKYQVTYYLIRNKLHYRRCYTSSLAPGPLVSLGSP